LKKLLGPDVAVELIAGTDGVFEVAVDGRVVFSKKRQGRFPDCGEIVRFIG
jgi:selT/selW/selH-like putative selenoprotein